MSRSYGEYREASMTLDEFISQWERFRDAIQQEGSVTEVWVECSDPVANDLMVSVKEMSEEERDAVMKRLDFVDGFMLAVYGDVLDEK